MGSHQEPEAPAHDERQQGSHVVVDHGCRSEDAEHRVRLTIVCDRPSQSVEVWLSVEDAKWVRSDLKVAVKAVEACGYAVNNRDSACTGRVLS